MLNHIKWRYSYGRQCYKTKYAKTQVVLPVTSNRDLNEEYMANMVECANHWRVVESSCELQSETAENAHTATLLG